jgi:cytochrome b
MVSLVAIAFLTTDDARRLHEAAGYAVLALIGARLVWGVVGTRHALFVSFIAGPRAMMRYLHLLRDGRAPRYLGHNPAGGAMIVALLMLLVVVSGSGWLSETDAFFGVPWVDHLHHYSAHLLLALVGLHLAGVIVASWLHRENLVLAMITGHKPLNLGERAKFEHECRTAAIAPNRPH